MANERTKKTEKIYIPRKEIIKEILPKPLRKKYLSKSQEEYYNTLLSHEITFCIGPAGTGKSHIAMKAAVDLLMSEDNF